MAVCFLYDDVRDHVDRFIVGLLVPGGVWLQLLYDLTGTAHLTLRQPKLAGDGGVLLFAQQRKTVGHDLLRRRFPRAAALQLQQQTFLHAAGTHPGRLQRLQHGKRPFDQRRVDAQMLYGRHVLAVQIAVVIQQFHHVAAQGGGGLVQPSVLQLPGKAGGKGCHGAVPAPSFRDESGWLAASAGIGAVLYPFQQGVFLGGTLQKVRQLLGGHQQHPGGLQQLRRYSQCLLRLQPQFQIGHSRHLLPHFSQLYEKPPQKASGILRQLAKAPPPTRPEEALVP